jgi:hypothetical protein
VVHFSDNLAARRGPFAARALVRRAPHRGAPPLTAHVPLRRAPL